MLRVSVRWELGYADDGEERLQEENEEEQRKKRTEPRGLRFSSGSIASE